MRDFSTQSKKSEIVFQMEIDPDLIWKREISTLCRGQMIKMRDFFTQSQRSVLAKYNI